MTIDEWQQRMNDCDSQEEYNHLMAIRPKGAGLNVLTRKAGHTGQVMIDGEDQSLAGLGVRVSGGGDVDRPLLAKLNSPPKKGRIPRG